MIKERALQMLCTHASIVHSAGYKLQSSKFILTRYLRVYSYYMHRAVMYTSIVYEIRFYAVTVGCKVAAPTHGL